MIATTKYKVLNMLLVLSLLLAVVACDEDPCPFNPYFLSPEGSYEDACVGCLEGNPEGDGCSWLIFDCVEGNVCTDDTLYETCWWNKCRTYGGGNAPGDCEPDAINSNFDWCARNQWCDNSDTCEECVSWPGCWWEGRDGEETCGDGRFSNQEPPDTFRTSSCDGTSKCP